MSSVIESSLPEYEQVFAFVVTASSNTSQNIERSSMNVRINKPVDEIQRLIDVADYLKKKADETRAAAAQLMLLRSVEEGLLD